MEISIHTSSESGWWGNTIPVVWSITCVHIIEHFHGGLMGQFALYLASNARDLYRSMWPISDILLLNQSKGEKLRP